MNRRSVAPEGLRNEGCLYAAIRDGRPRSSTALLYWPNACSTAVFDATYDPPQRSVSIERVTRKPIKVRGKATLRFAGAQARNAPIAVSVAISYGTFRAAGFAIL
jgi:hypothetical protein